MENKIKINCVIGVDPGAGGGLAVFIPGQMTKAVKMPKDITDLRDFFAYYRENYKPIVFLEKLSVRPDDIRADGDKPNMGKLFRVQKMMANYEHLKAIIETAGIPYVMVHPLKWQTALWPLCVGQRTEMGKVQFARTRIQQIVLICDT